MSSTNRTKIALITGGTRGIGRAIADKLAPDHHLIIVGSSDSTHDTAAELNAQGHSAQGLALDLADTGAIAAVVQELRVERSAVQTPHQQDQHTPSQPQQDHHPLTHLDALVHSAGVIAHDPVTETTPDQWQHAFDVNLFAVAELTRQLLPQLRAAHGTVVAINSGAGQFSGAGFGPYAATKFALRAYADALREEHRNEFRVTSIHPGKVDSDMQVSIQSARGNTYDESQFLRADSVAKAVRFAIDATDDAMVESLTIRPANGN
ncbi:MAG TPA: SDR family oxidoreductase [Candidatus Corynebacterium gallistercoris]|uniref:SDR family oxidoreductase n=1 Tax=Candidatus Corynebacterium gallistercoris TaxID=2838530 RepID=A0A9D1RWL9_9CORY|nr:SDR family oxidoreductase [Candidatus Corynebacterium gallistercoris]